MLKNLEITSLSHEGVGIGSSEGKRIFIPGTLPGEKINCQITQKRSSYNKGQVLDFLSTSPDRIEPACEHFNTCGGCSLQHMNDSLQIQLKQQSLLDQLKHFGRVEPKQILPPLLSATLGYRRKARLGVKFVIKKDKVLVGFREKSSRYLADLKQCEVLHPSVGHSLTELSDLVRSLSTYQHIAQIEVAVGDGDVALVFRHLKDLTETDISLLTAYGEKKNFHIYLQPNPPAKIHRLWPLSGAERLSYTLPDLNLEFLFHPLDFTQIHLEMNRLMVNQALTLLDIQKNEKVLDLFCGIGNFSLSVARFAAHVTGIEGDPEMVHRARENAEHNGITNTVFDVANLMAPISGQWCKNQYDKILLDPPRAGALELLPSIPTFNAKRILYVSCNPSTLARDAGELVHKYGYQLQQAGVMNMFPHTAHIEAMAVFDKD